MERLYLVASALSTPRTTLKFGKCAEILNLPACRCYLPSVPEISLSNQSGDLERLSECAKSSP